MTGSGSRPRWQLALIVGVFALVQTAIAWNRSDYLWFIDEETFFGHGVRIVHNGRIGWNIDNWQPPLSYLVHSFPLLFHPSTPSLTGPVVQDPDLPPGPETVEGKKNPVGLDSSTWQLRQAVEARGGRFSDYVFVARLPMIVLSCAGLAVSWRVFRLLGADPLPGVVLLATTRTFLVEQARIVADPLISVLVIVMVWLAIEFARRPSLGNSARFGASVGLSLASKLSVIPLLPAFGLAIVSWMGYFSRCEESPGRYRVPGIRRAAAFLATAGSVAFLTLWTIYGFQFGSLDGMLAAHRIPNTPRILQRLPAIGKTPIPMPSFVLTFVTNQKVAAGQTNLKVDGVPRAPLQRRLRHYVLAAVDNTSVYLLPLAVMAAVAMALDPRCRLLVAGFLLLLAAYLAGLSMNSIQMWPRRALVVVNLVVMIAGLAWREGATRGERAWRAPLLTGHVAWSLLQVALFMAGEEPITPADVYSG